MSKSRNKVFLSGNVGQEPEVINFENGNKLVKCSLATSETWKDKQTGEKKERVEWHNLVFNGKIAEIAEKYVKKGDRLDVEGSIYSRTWEDDKGVKRKSVEIRVSDIILSGKKEISTPQIETEQGDDLPF